MTDRTNPKNEGFTLTELMFAMAFLAFVMIFVVTTIIQTMRIYNKGLAIRQINQAGRQFSEEFTRTLKYADAVSFQSNGNKAATLQRICANGVTYAWNIENQPVKNRYTGGDSNIPIQLIRVDDKSGLLCTNGSINISRSASRDILSTQLSVQRLTLDSTSEAGRIVTMNALISTTGINRPSVSVTTPSGFECPAGGDGAFCAFGEFRATTYVRN